MALPYDRIIIIYNPQATGQATARSQALAVRLEAKRLGVPIDLAPTEYAGHAEELARAAAATTKRPLIISVSGDGGYHEVINGALAAQRRGAAPICLVLPSGNANDHARATQPYQRLSDVIARGRVRRLDALRLRSDKGQQRWAHSYIGLGVSPVIARELNRYKLGPLRDAWLSLRGLWRYQPVQLEDAGQTIAVGSLVFANIPSMAKFLKVAPHVRPDDGSFAVNLIPFHSRWQFARALLWEVFIGAPRAQPLKSYTFTTREAMPIQLDGEVRELAAGETVTVTVEPGALQNLF